VGKHSSGEAREKNSLRLDASGRPGRKSSVILALQIPRIEDTREPPERARLPRGPLSGRPRRNPSPESTLHYRRNGNPEAEPGAHDSLLTCHRQLDPSGGLARFGGLVPGGGE